MQCQSLFHAFCRIPHPRQREEIMGIAFVSARCSDRMLTATLLGFNSAGLDVQRDLQAPSRINIARHRSTSQMVRCSIEDDCRTLRPTAGQSLDFWPGPTKVKGAKARQKSICYHTHRTRFLRVRWHLGRLGGRTELTSRRSRLLQPNPMSLCH